MSDLDRVLKTDYVPTTLWSAMMELLMREYEETHDERFCSLYYDMKFSQQAYRYDLVYLCECSKEFLEVIKCI